MSDYAKTTNFTAKDSLSSGDPAKLIKGSDFDTEFDALAVAVATKYDTNDIASQAQAEALSSNAVLMTPLGVSYVLAENGGMLADIQALADPNADRILFWDDSAGAVVGMTVSTGLAISTTNLTVSTNLQAITALAVTDGNFIVGNGSAWVAESGDTARTSLGVGTGDSPTFTGVTVGSAVVTGPSANRLEVGGRVAFIHDNAALTSAEVFYSTSNASGGSAGDIWFKHEA